MQYRIGYIGFGGMAGGAFKYETATGKVTEIGPSGQSFGMIEVDRNDPDKLLTRTCGVWSSQLYEPWTEENSPAWGDQFYRSEDGGKTWQNITPGAEEGPWGEKWQVSNYIDTNGYGNSINSNALRIFYDLFLLPNKLSQED